MNAFKSVTFHNSFKINEKDLYLNHFVCILFLNVQTKCKICLHNSNLDSDVKCIASWSRANPVQAFFTIWSNLGVNQASATLISYNLRTGTRVLFLVYTQM